MNARERRREKRQEKLLGAIGRERAIQAALERAGETIRALEADAKARAYLAEFRRAFVPSSFAQPQAG